MCLPDCAMRVQVGDRLGWAQIGGGGVADTVGVERQQRADVVRGRDTEGLDAHQLARVAPRLLRAVHPQAHELELGVVRDEPRRVPADVARAPLDDLVRHSAGDDSFRLGMTGPDLPAILGGDAALRRERMAAAGRSGTTANARDCLPRSTPVIGGPGPAMSRPVSRATSRRTTTPPTGSRSRTAPIRSRPRWPRAAWATATRW